MEVLTLYRILCWPTVFLPLCCECRTNRTSLVPTNNIVLLNIIKTICFILAEHNCFITLKKNKKLKHKSNTLVKTIVVCFSTYNNTTLIIKKNKAVLKISQD